MTVLALPPVETYNPVEVDLADAFPPDKYLLPLPAGVERPGTTAEVPRTEDCLVVFQGADHDWYWHLLAAGNRAIIAGGVEGYHRLSRAVLMGERAVRRAAVVMR